MQCINTSSEGFHFSKNIYWFYLSKYHAMKFYNFHQQRPPPTLSPLQKTTATVLTRGASLILIGFLVATLVIFAVAKIWDNSRLIHFNMELSLLLAHCCLLPVGIEEPWVCKLLSIMIHFFFLVCFTFMFLESLHLYSLVGWVVQS